MDYELAKQLKNAGYPQVWNDGVWFQYKRMREPDIYTQDTEYGYPIRDTTKTEAIIIPTLSEIIEACGDDFLYLSRDAGRWDAKANTFIVSKMSSPEEAVARLWLKIKAGE